MEISRLLNRSLLIERKIADFIFLIFINHYFYQAHFSSLIFYQKLFFFRLIKLNFYQTCFSSGLQNCRLPDVHEADFRRQTKPEITFCGAPGQHPDQFLL